MAAPDEALYYLDVAKRAVDEVLARRVGDEVLPERALAHHVAHAVVDVDARFEQARDHGFAVGRFHPLHLRALLDLLPQGQDPLELLGLIGFS